MDEDTAMQVDDHEEQLDEQIAHFRQHIASLRNQLQVQTTNLLSADSTRQLLQNSTSVYSSTSVSPFDISPVTASKILSRSDAQKAHDDQNLYRLGAGVTSFKVRDPDPNAVDSGRVLGLRFDVVSNTRFLRPYYVMLNRPYPASPRHLRVHRHTVPPCIPLSGLVSRHLPPPPRSSGPGKEGDVNDSGAEAEAEPPSRRAAKQDLSRFARELRREIVRYHNRAGAVAELSEAAAAVAVAAETVEDDGDSDALADVRAADPQMKHVELTWADGRTGRLVMDDDGKVERTVVYRGGSRDYETKRRLVGNCDRVEDVVSLLRTRGRGEEDG